MQAVTVQAQFEHQVNVPLLMELYDELVKEIEGEANALPTFDEAWRRKRVLALRRVTAPDRRGGAKG